MKPEHGPAEGSLSNFSRVAETVDGSGCNQKSNYPGLGSAPPAAPTESREERKYDRDGGQKDPYQVWDADRHRNEFVQGPAELPQRS